LLDAFANLQVGKEYSFTANNAKWSGDYNYNGKFASALVNDICQSYVMLEETIKTLHLKVHYLSTMGLMIC
jgi:hypothetical protein